MTSSLWRRTATDGARRRRLRPGLWLTGLLFAVVPVVLPAPSAWAAPDGPGGPGGPGAPGGPTISVSIPGQPSNVVTIIVLTTVLGVAPAVLLLCTSFTKIVVVLSLARSAIGTQTVPPNQVLVGLALFLSLFVMGPTLDAMQSTGCSPTSPGPRPRTRPTPTRRSRCGSSCSNTPATTNSP